MGHNYYGEPAWPNDLLYILHVVFLGDIACVVGLEVLDPPLYDPRTVDYLIHTMKGDVTTVELIFDSSERSGH